MADIFSFVLSFSAGYWKGHSRRLTQKIKEDMGIGPHIRHRTYICVERLWIWSWVRVAWRWGGPAGEGEDDEQYLHVITDIDKEDPDLKDVIAEEDEKAELKDIASWAVSAGSPLTTLGTMGLMKDGWTSSSWTILYTEMAGNYPFILYYIYKLLFCNFLLCRRHWRLCSYEKRIERTKLQESQLIMCVASKLNWYIDWCLYQGSNFYLIHFQTAGEGTSPDWGVKRDGRGARC